MRMSLIAMAVLGLAGAAQAAPPPNAQSNAVDANFTGRSSRVVYVCDTSMATRRAFTRQYGSQEFVTADQALKRGGAWSQPKCVTAGEARRLQRAMADRS